MALVLAGAAALVLLRQPSLPRPGSESYAQVATAFYRGLAALEVGLLDDARDQFARAAELVPGEPAAWANLALAQLRLGDVEPAAPAIERAMSLAPDRADVLLLAARLESARGRLEEGVALLRRATVADPRDLRAKFALVDELERAGQGDESDEVPRLLNELVAQAPANLAVLVERARVAARRRDAAAASDSVARLQALSSAWPEIALEQLRGLQQAVASSQWQDAARSAALLRNVLARVPAFTESLTAVRTPAELVGTPIAQFVALAPPSARPSPPDTELSYASQAIGPAPSDRDTVLAIHAPGAAGPVLFGVSSDGLRRLDAPAVAVAQWDAGSADRGAAVVDWNHDFRSDLVLVGTRGVRLLLQSADGGFEDRTPADAEGALPPGVTAAWSADVEMDGDLDVVLGVESGPTIVLRNNGDGSWRRVPSFAAVGDARAFAWADLDGDADPDAAFLDGAGALHVLLNRQAGAFTAESSLPGLPPAAALAVADMDADGALDVLTLGRDGSVRGASRRGGAWAMRPITPGTPAAPVEGGARLVAADLDNNGALDLVVSTPTASRIWLGDGLQAQPLETDVSGEVLGVLDQTGDGTLDLIGATGGQWTRWVGSGSRGYHWKAIRVQAQQNAGDQRINSFGLGGDIEVRSGLLWQKQPIADPVIHFGLGTASGIDVARIVWPNGVAQAEFDVPVDGALVAEQRLKGSCPWVFANDGQSMRFVTDFLWRSPLGLRINAQDTAGVVQTEDWVRIRGDQLAPVDGAYDVRITAELWETHFFDHVSLMVVDHPAESEVFVDERFSATRPPALAVQTLGALTPLARAVDQAGRDVAALVAEPDGRTLATFAKGAYQGIAGDHYVEFEIPARRPGGTPVLVAQGWVYPTDSSINMAIGQGAAVRPSGLVLEALVAGAWRVVEPDLGFPAGKNKTLVIDLATPADVSASMPTRFRLRTNLEIYWDWLALGQRVDARVRSTRLQASEADLRYRGFSKTVSPRGETPETPIYAPLASVSQRWRDLEGYYTRFGDVRELLAAVDDRYVIMNAGDEMRLRFPAQPAPAAGWRRDFVLIGDGWEKDGDYNTGHSQTVLPLPDHAKPDYGVGVTPGDLEADPVYRRHQKDWTRFHTRYVTPSAFLQGVRPGR